MPHTLVPAPLVGPGQVRPHKVASLRSNHNRRIADRADRMRQVAHRPVTGNAELLLVNLDLTGWQRELLKALQVLADRAHRKAI